MLIINSALVGAVFIDLSKVFETVSHSKLLESYLNVELMRKNMLELKTICLLLEKVPQVAIIVFLMNNFTLEYHNYQFLVLC